MSAPLSSLSLPALPSLTSWSAATSRDAFAYWMLLVAAMRVLSVFLGYFNPMQLKSKVFTHASKEFTFLQARTFAVWTTVTAAVCVATAFNVYNDVLLLLALVTFVVANTYFALELVVYRTVSVASISAPFVFATTSIVWIAKLLFM